MAKFIQDVASVSLATRHTPFIVPTILLRGGTFSSRPLIFPVASLWTNIATEAVEAQQKNWLVRWERQGTFVHDGGVWQRGRQADTRTDVRRARTEAGVVRCRLGRG